jgi:hypothetical protein
VDRQVADRADDSEEAHTIKNSAAGSR